MDGEEEEVACEDEEEEGGEEDWDFCGCRWCADAVEEERAFGAEGAEGEEEHGDAAGEAGLGCCGGGRGRRGCVRGEAHAVKAHASSFHLLFPRGSYVSLLSVFALLFSRISTFD